MKTTIDAEHARTLLTGFEGKGILVLGDIMLDEFLWGRCERISPEAPVPVVHVSKETFRLGGAGNVAHNIASLGGRVSIVSVIGIDRFGDALVEQIKNSGIPTQSIIRDSKRVTTVKTRIVAHSQQVVRADRESSSPVAGEAEEGIINAIETLVPDQEGIIVSDYAKGLITENVVDRLLRCAARCDVPVYVDPSVKHFYSYRNVKLIVPNTLKSRLLTHIEPQDEQSRIEIGRRLAESSSSSVLLTLGESGMMLFHNDQIVSIPAMAREVYDVTGASDTVMSTIALSIAAGASMPEAAILANFAAGVVVGKIGTATVKVKEILREIKIRQEEPDPDSDA
ncbi:D-glycero-beta-D-manno-heptose-7-phosphate kinase [Acidobacteriota bacterium]